MRILKKLACAAAALAAAAAMTISAFADYTYSLDDSKLVSDVLADTKAISGTEGVFEKNDLKAAETDDAISMRLSVFNEFLDAEYWNDPNVQVCVDVKLETEGVNVMGFIAGFDSKWKWINPSNYVNLEYGKWVTVSETGKHFYEGWSERGPNQFMFQIRSQWDSGEQGYVKASIKNFRIIGPDGAVTTVPETTTTTEATTTTAATTTEATTTTVQEEPTDVPVESAEAASAEAATAESAEAPTAEAPAETTAATTAATTTAAPATTTEEIVTAKTDAPAPDMSNIVLTRPDTEKESSPLVIIVGAAAAVVVVAAVVIGYLISKKKKF